MKTLCKYKIIYPLFLLIIILANNQCWYYSFKGTIPPHINSIAIPEFQNNTAEFNLSETVTEQVKINFIRENILDVIDRENSNSILYGEITNINDSPLVYESSETGERVEEYQVTISIQIEWYDKIKDENLIEKQFTGKGEYDPTGATDATREEAINQALDDLTQDVINSILTIW